MSGRSRTILVVEDIDEISTQMGAMLRQKGHVILNAANADEAMRIAERDRPVMILTDLDLPTFDALLRRIRAHSVLKDMPVAIIDINGPEINPRDNVKVLRDFEQLDQLLDSAE